MTPQPPYVATLRVYEPVEVLDAAGLAWRDAADRPDSDPLLAPVVERLRALRAAAAVPPLVAPEHDGPEVLLLTVAGERFGCPVATRLRCWLAFEQVRDAAPDELLYAFWPPSVVAAAEREFADWRASHPDAVPHIRSHPWEIPLAWFVPFAGADRHLVREPTGPTGGAPPLRRLYYLTEMTPARQRTARSLATLRRTVGEGPLIEDTRELGAWLESFHPDSRVELDHGGLIHLPGQDPGTDSSAADVHEALAALAAGDTESAVRRYRRLVSRWRSYAQYGYCS